MILIIFGSIVDCPPNLKILEVFFGLNPLFENDDPQNLKFLKDFFGLYIQYISSLF